jgi:hypothetical protein
MAGVQYGLAAYQLLTSHPKREQRELERLANQQPKAEADQSIGRYYSEALRRYNVSPYATQAYKVGQQNIGTNMAAGLNTLTDRRQGLGGVGKLVQGANDSTQRLGVMGEQQKANDLRVLGAASQLKAADDKYLFNVNQMTPYNRKYNLKMMKAAGETNKFNSGLMNVQQGAQDDQKMATELGSAAIGSAGSLSAMCDETLKENIVPTEYGLKEILKLNAVEFDYIHPQVNDGKKHIGFVAQEVQKIVPESVSNETLSDKDYLKINYAELVPVLVKGMQEQQKQINHLTSLISV